MLTQEKYEECKKKIKKSDEWREMSKTVDASVYHKEKYKIYEKEQLAKYKLRQAELEAYLIAVDNYAEIIKIMEESEDFHEFAKAMESKFGFSFNQSRYFKNMTIQSFSPKARDEKKQELERVKRDIKIFEEDLKS